MYGGGEELERLFYLLRQTYERTTYRQMIRVFRQCKLDRDMDALYRIIAKNGRVYQSQSWIAKTLGVTQQAISKAHKRKVAIGRIRILSGLSSHSQKQVIELVHYQKVSPASFSSDNLQPAAYSYIPEKQKIENSNPVIDSKVNYLIVTTNTITHKHKESPLFRDLSLLFYSTMGAIGSLRLTALLRHKIYKGLGMRIYNGKEIDKRNQRGHTSFVLSIGCRIRDAFLSYRRYYQRSIFSGRGLRTVLSTYDDCKGPIDQTFLSEKQGGLAPDIPITGLQEDKGYWYDQIHL